MSIITIPKGELKTVVRESVREVLTDELRKLRAFLVPFISSREQKDIERRYKKPSRRVAKSIVAKL